MRIYRIERESMDYQIVSSDPPKKLKEKTLYEHLNISELSCFKLEKRKKLTSVLKEGTFSLHGFIANSSFCEILQKFNAKNIQFIPIIIPDLKDYYFILINSDLTNLIDYNKTKFQIVEDFLGDINVINQKFDNTRNGVIKAFQDYCVGQVLIEMEPITKYFFNENVDLNEFAIFRVGHFDKSFYISEDVKKEMENNKITGIKFIESNKF